MIEEKQSTNTAILAEDTELDAPVIVVGDDAEPTLPLPDPEVPKKKKRVFLKVLSVYALLLLAAAAVGLWFLYSYLAAFEANTPNPALRKYLEWVETENYEAIYEASGFEESGLNTKEQYLVYFDTLFSDAGELSLREKTTTDSSRHYYSLYGDDEKLADLVAARSPEGDGSTWYVTTETVYQEPFTLIASDDVRLTVNGTDIHLLSLTSREVQSEVFPTAEDAELTLPVVRAYTLEGLLNPPTVTALTLSGEACTVEMDGQTIRVLSPDTETVQQANKEFAIEAATTYAKFVAKDATRTQLLKYVHKGSELYRTIRNFSNVWFNTHDSYEFRDITVTNYSRYADTDFSCIVSFQPVYTKEGKTIEGTPVHYQMTFVQLDGEWWLYSLSQAIAEQSGTSDSETAGATTTVGTAATTTTAAATTTTTAAD